MKKTNTAKPKTCRRKEDVKTSDKSPNLMKNVETTVKTELRRLAMESDFGKTSKGPKKASKEAQKKFFCCSNGADL